MNGVIINLNQKKYEKAQLFANPDDAVPGFLIVNHRADLRVKALYVLPVVMTGSVDDGGSLAGVNLLAPVVDKVEALLAHRASLVRREADSDISVLLAAVPVAVNRAPNLQRQRVVVTAIEERAHLDKSGLVARLHIVATMDEIVADLLLRRACARVPAHAPSHHLAIHVRQPRVLESRSRVKVRTVRVLPDVTQDKVIELGNDNDASRRLPARELLLLARPLVADDIPRLAYIGRVIGRRRHLYGGRTGAARLIECNPISHQ